MLVWIKDIKSNIFSWLAVALTMMISTASCALALGILATGDELGTALGGSTLGMAICAIVIVVNNQMALLLEEHVHVYRSWWMIGMPGSLIITVISSQLAVISIVSGVGGIGVSKLLTVYAEMALHNGGIPVHDIEVTSNVAAIAIVICLSATAIGVLKPIRRIFKPVETPRLVWIVLRLLIALSLVVTAAIPGFIITDAGDLLGMFMGYVILVAALYPWLSPLLDSWTHTMGIAGANIRARRKFSSPQIVPWLILGGLLVGIGSGLRAITSAGETQNVSSWQVFVVVFGPTVAPCLASAIGTSFIMWQRIRADSLGLKHAGADATASARIQVGEAFCLTGTAAGVIAAISIFIVVCENRLLANTSALTGLWWQAYLIVLLAMFLTIAAAKLVIQRLVSRP